MGMIRRPIVSKNVITASAVTATGAGGAVVMQDFMYGNAVAKLNVSAASGTTPTLDAVLQQSLDGGTTWVDVGRFAQITAATTNPHYINLVEAFTIVGAVGDGTIAASSTGVTLLSDTVRVKYTIGGTTPSFTFTLDIIYS